MGLLTTGKRLVRRMLLAVIPAGARRWLVARYPRLPLAPHSVGESGARFDGSAWERFYAERDPYGLGRSDYEREKYQRTLDTIGAGPFSRALEVGCSVGVFTGLLAPRCRALLAVDISENAVQQARRALAGREGVVCERRTLPAGMPDGPFDLIVCSDVLYYWPIPDLRRGLGAFEAALAPGGALVAVHYTGKAERGTPLDGNVVHDLLARESRLEHAGALVYEKYRIDRFVKPQPSAP